MTNHVSPEMAHKLKQAGFPQPSPLPSQTWVKDGLIVTIRDTDVRYVYPYGGGIMSDYATG